MEKIKFKGYEKFNDIQNKVLLLAVILGALIFLFPPWEAANANGNVLAVGHHIIFFPPANYRYPSLDLPRLFVEILGIAMVASAGIFFTRD